jgi:hypothetical protein
LALTTSGEFIISTVRLGPAEHVSLVRTLVRLSGGGVVDRCGFCGSTDGPFTSIEGMFTVLMCPACLARRSRGRGPYPELSDAEMRAGLDLLATWVLEQKAAANRQVVAVMRQRLERGELVVPMYGPLGFAWLQRQAEIAEQLIAARAAAPPPGS